MKQKIVELAVCEHCLHTWIPQKDNSKRTHLQCGNCKRLTKTNIHKVKVKV